MIFCEVIVREKLIWVFFVLFLLDVIIKKNMLLKVLRIVIGGLVVLFLILESIGRICDEY